MRSLFYVVMLLRHRLVGSLQSIEIIPRVPLRCAAADRGLVRPPCGPIDWGLVSEGGARSPHRDAATRRRLGNRACRGAGESGLAVGGRATTTPLRRSQRQSGPLHPGGDPARLHAMIWALLLRRHVRARGACRHVGNRGALHRLSPAKLPLPRRSRRRSPARIRGADRRPERRRSRSLLKGYWPQVKPAFLADRGVSLGHQRARGPPCWVLVGGGGPRHGPSIPRLSNLYWDQGRPWSWSSFSRS